MAPPILTLMPITATAPSAKKLRSSYLTRLSEHCIEQIASRVAGKVRDDSWGVFDGDADLNSVPRNADLWAADLAPQLTGNAAWKTGWRQGAGGVAITRRHLLQCAHWTDSFKGLTVRFISTDGQYFETTILEQYPLSGYMTYGGASRDFEVFLLAAELPEWVHVFPIMQVSDALHSLVSPYNAGFRYPPLPLVAISQGQTNAVPTGLQKLYVASANGYNGDDTIAGTPGVPFHKKHPDTRLYPYYYAVFTGDSGTPAFILVDGALSLVGIVTGWNFGVTMAWTESAIAFINELIARADAAAGISTGLTVTVTPEPTL